MKTSEATAEVFFTAFKSLGSDEKESVIQKMFSDPSIREDIMDLVLIEKSKKAKGKPMSAMEYFKSR